MNWENLTATEFNQAASETNTCIVPLGVMEKHAEHLPLGTDCFIAHTISTMAAEREAAVVYPSFFFGQIYEARCFPGTVNISPRLLLELLFEVLDDIARNGFNKIILYNGHGGNHHLLRYLAQSLLYEQKPYDLYMPLRRLTDAGMAEWEQMKETDYDGHAGEYETALMLGLRPDLVQMNKANDISGKPLGRFEPMADTYNGIWWYADYPEHYAGDGSAATIEKGQRLVELSVDYLAEYIGRVKADTIVPTLKQEFFERANNIGD